MAAGRRGWFASAALAASLSTAPSILVAQTPAPPRVPAGTPETVRQLVGRWDLVQAGAARQCTLTLGAETAGSGRVVRFPAICRRALPFLATVASWDAVPGNIPRLDDASGRTVLQFRKRGRAHEWEGTGPDGKQYVLSAIDRPRAAPPPSPAEQAALAARRTTQVDVASAPSPDTLPGRYAMMRQRNREACRLILDGAGSDRSPARFDGACGDTGLSIFDPSGWRYAAGRLTLVARRGHTIDLVFEDGLWRKDPAIGAPLMLQKR